MCSLVITPTTLSARGRPAPRRKPHAARHCPQAGPAQRPRQRSFPVNCQSSQPPRPGQALLDVPGAADGGAAPLPRRCTLTPRLTAVCAADGEGVRERPDAAICHLGLAARKALPRSRAAEKRTYFVHTQDGRVHLPTADTTPDPPGGQGGLTPAEFHRKSKTLFIRTTSGISVESPASGTGLGARAGESASRGAFSKPSV